MHVFLKSHSWQTAFHIYCCVVVQQRNAFSCWLQIQAGQCELHVHDWPLSTKGVSSAIAQSHPQLTSFTPLLVHLISSAALSPWGRPQGSCLVSKGVRCVGLTTIPASCAHWLKILWVSTCWSLLGLSRHSTFTPLICVAIIRFITCIASRLSSSGCRLCDVYLNPVRVLKLSTTLVSFRRDGISSSEVLYSWYAWRH